MWCLRRCCLHLNARPSLPAHACRTNWQPWVFRSLSLTEEAFSSVTGTVGIRITWIITLSWNSCVKIRIMIKSYYSLEDFTSWFHDNGPSRIERQSVCPSCAYCKSPPLSRDEENLDAEHNLGWKSGSSSFIQTLVKTRGLGWLDTTPCDCFRFSG